MRAVSWVNHLVAGTSVVGVSALAGLGVVGQERLPERFDAKLVVVAPAAPDDPSSDALRIIEVIDQDFGDQERRGHERYVPVDFGVPTDVEVRSDTAPDDVRVERIGDEVRIRIGDPDVFITGRHRYVLEYTLPAARLSTGRLALDVIGTEETFETGRFEVVVTGFELAGPTCSVGASDATGGCSLAADGDVYRTVIAPLEPGQGITVAGDIVGARDVVVPPPPPIPAPREEPPDRRTALAIGSVPLGLLGAAGVFRLLARAGRNEVHGAGGAADAAFGGLAPPGALDPSQDPRRASGTHQVSDRRLAELATTEFVPPPGLAPWQGAVLLREAVDDTTVSAWFSGLAGLGAIELEQEGKKQLAVSPGPKFAQVDDGTRLLLVEMFGGAERIVLGGYDERFATLWGKVRSMQHRTVGQSGWWTRFGPGNTGTRSVYMVAVFAGAALLAAGGLVFLAFTGALSALVAALAFAVIVPALVAVTVYSPLLPSRSATGSAVALRTESFRRFLDASEGQHVEWAWERGVIREYSAWAVALGAADAWSKALERSSVVPKDPSLTTPLLVYSMSSALSSAHVKPSSSGSSGGGSVGSGGGGGRSGSW